MAKAKSTCLYCDGKGKVKRFGGVYKCYYCFPPEGAIKELYTDKGSVFYDYQGREVKNELVKHRVRVQPQEKALPKKGKRNRTDKSVSNKRSR
jgi:hypothetical protein